MNIADLHGFVVDCRDFFRGCGRLANRAIIIQTAIACPRNTRLATADAGRLGDMFLAYAEGCRGHENRLRNRTPVL